MQNLFPATSLSLLLLKKHFLILKLLFIYAKENWSHWAVELLRACKDVLMTATCESAYACLTIITWTALLKSMRPYPRHNLSAFVISGTLLHQRLLHLEHAHSFKREYNFLCVVEQCIWCASVQNPHFLAVRIFSWPWSLIFRYNSSPKWVSEGYTPLGRRKPGRTKTHPPSSTIHFGHPINQRGVSGDISHTQMSAEIINVPEASLKKSYII